MISREIARWIYKEIVWRFPEGIARRILEKNVEEALKEFTGEVKKIAEEYLEQLLLNSWLIPQEIIITIP